MQNFLSMLPSVGARQIQLIIAKDIVLQFVSCEHQDQDQKIIGPQQLGALLDELEPLVTTTRYFLNHIKTH